MEQPNESGQGSGGGGQDEEMELLGVEYRQLVHAMQSGVAATIQDGDNDTSPKHLRVGVNSALSDQGALAKLLMDKGIFTQIEYMRAIVEGMRSEVRRYEELLTERKGVKIRLG